MINANVALKRRGALLRKSLWALGIIFTLGAAMNGPASASSPAAANSYGDDVAFLKKFVQVVELHDASGRARLVVVPKFQGRVMTSTCEGNAGASFGWINRELIASGEVRQHMNPLGGEDRFWMGPEGGQFSIFFAKGVKFDLDHWFTPAPLDTEPMRLEAADSQKARFTTAFSLVNYSGTKFDVRVERDVLLIGDVDAWNILSLKPSQNIKMVAFESVNTIINNGSNPWKKSTGLLSIWILGMFNSSPATTVVVPIKPGPENQLGKPVNADYFGAVPPERLIIKGNAAFFSGDSKYRSKIGINSKRAQPILGSYDAGNKVLTLVQYTLQKGRTDYVNSMWEIQKDPYAGDVVNSYNDGPPAPSAKQLGAFYELETSSPAVELSPREKLEHRHRTFHLVGAEQDLDMIAKTLLSVGLKEITTALPR